jgi:hypothetical protein
VDFSWLSSKVSWTLVKWPWYLDFEKSTMVMLEGSTCKWALVTWSLFLTYPESWAPADQSCRAKQSKIYI